MFARAPVLLIVSGYLSIASLAQLAWLGLRAGALPPSSALALGAAPLLVYLLLTWGERSRTQLLAKSFACFGLLPILLLMWAATNAGDREPPALAAVAPQPAATQDLDLSRLFLKAHAVRDVGMAHGGMLMMRHAGFPDGSELMFFRFTNTVQAEEHLAFMTRSLQGSPATLSGRAGVRLTMNPDRFVFVEWHGRDLVQVSAQDEAQVLARLEAQAVPPAVTEVVEAAEVQTASVAPVWPFAVSYVIVHLLAFVGLVSWAGTRATRVGAAAGAVHVSVAQLRARLTSLEALGMPLTLTRSEAEDEIVVAYRFADEARRHHVILTIDGRKREVRVRERTNQAGAAPKDARERDMRPAAGPRFDPSRPSAQKVWGHVAQTSILEPEQLAAVPLVVQGDRVELPAEYAQNVDPERMIHVLCAVATHSGFAWQPVFFKG